SLPNQERTCTSSLPPSNERWVIVTPPRGRGRHSSRRLKTPRPNSRMLKTVKTPIIKNKTHDMAAAEPMYIHSKPVRYKYSAVVMPACDVPPVPPVKM